MCGTQGLKLLAKLGELVCDELHRFRCKAKLPTTPDDLLCELCFLPADGGIESSQQRNSQCSAYFHFLQAQEQKQIVDVKPSAVLVLAEQRNDILCSLVGLL